MSSSVRRKGKPGKGSGKGSSRGGRGGRSNASKSHGGGGSGGNRKASSRTWDDGDDFCIFSESRSSARPSNSNVRKGDTRPKWKPKAKVPLQTLHMTSENQEKVKALLRDLQEQDADAGSERSISGEEEEDEPDCDDAQYWLAGQEASLVPDADPSDYAGSGPVEPYNPELIVSTVAVQKLSRYGFNTERCQAALRVCDGDVGASLEYLLIQCFSETFGERMKISEAVAHMSEDECVEPRQEEAFALKSICGEKFVERIQNRVWTIGLELEYLTSKFRKSKQKESTKNIQETSLDICKFYLKGNCKFGSKCKFKHEVPPNQIVGRVERSVDDSHLNAHEDESFLYELEIRFSKDHKYPYEAPLVAFYSTNESLPLACRLHISEFLYGKALTFAETAEPVVYSLITLLGEESEIVNLLTNTHHKYSDPPVNFLPVSSGIRITNPFCRKPVIPHNSFVSSRIPEVEKESLPEEETDEDEGPAPVVVENESYVNLKKKISKRYDWQAKSVHAENAKICKQFQIKQTSRQFQSILQERQSLPAWEERETILKLLSKHQVLVISGMTGCGKTTQIPQFILDESLNGPPEKVANIICTQPRRISAISVAERVAKERAERVGLTVGYQIRLESVKSSATRLLYCTTGVLLRRLEGDTALQGITHIIVDEVHERTEESDFLLLVLKDIVLQRPTLQVILMSATLNAELFSEYFSSCPVITIPGRTFPVDQFFLEDAIAVTRYVIPDGSPYMRSMKQMSKEKLKARRSRTAFEEVEEDLRLSLHLQDQDSVRDAVPDQQLDFKQLLARYKGVSKSVIKTMSIMDFEKVNLELIEALLEWIVEGKHSYPPGAILVFLPGLAEIKMLYEQLQSNSLFNNRRSYRCVVHPLHSSLSSEEQQAVFIKPPVGVTKIIISTNIAETSITIDDVVYVIDSGKMKEKRYDASKGMESLEDTFVSQANALQRKGRAGRVASGVCFHLFTSHHFSHQLLKQQLPEIQRVPLEQLCLRIKILEMFSTHNLQSVFSRLIEPPHPDSLRASKIRLRDLGALTTDEKLTPLGYHLASLPVDVRIGKLMLFGSIFRCLDPALTIAASLAFKSPFVSPWDKKEEANQKKLEFAFANSDYLALLQAYKGWQLSLKEGMRTSYNYCRQNFLSGRVLQEMASLKRQFTELLSDIGFAKEGLRAREIEKRALGGDGILEATGEEANSNAENPKLISAMLCAALYPNVVQVKSPEGKFQKTSTGAVRMQPKSDELKFVTKNDGYVHIHPSSVNYQVRHFDSPYLLYHEKIKTSRVFIRDCSMVSVYPLVLFGGGQVNVQLQRGEFVVSLDDGWIRFAAASHQVAELVKELRCELDQLLQDKIKNPSIDLCMCPRGSRIISTIVKLVTTQ
ncbi:putative ATP-dependent RNA helicase DHX57 [Myotis daubentonii]|uniref:putative ATP-dependent RNA helicase DHX57 n=1 Tax=Myotis daubentonii TaxID=98922 RepID=UPI0028734696|nr:putative ATP-dependent RNA helicase DHX57 [Myotis daubentonii]XP_059516027.1 putative ATP-dependent RNA helicase DHX57 [Myotis daubentonii]XP_059516028.1 putative ATP-dependent RNA helicase DHX57 [Myotis daubentonii]XP_059516029.1 putative ATP-dependent RNA helicase DHX57 [Myotis daubentonii]XP_059516030.1 putative ATP-dependent RNA helicase DHX57 [Myotis daubentonii]